MKVALAAALACFSLSAYADNYLCNNGLFRGEGIYRQGTSTHTYQAEVKRTMLNEDSFMIEQAITLPDMTFHTSARIEKNAQGDLKIYQNNGNTQTGEGYCFADEAASITCHVQKFSRMGNSHEATLHITADTIYRIGSHSYSGRETVKFHDHLHRVE